MISVTISPSVATDGGPESITTPSMSKITPPRHRPVVRLATSVVPQGVPPVPGRLAEVFQYLIIVLLARRGDLQDQRDVCRARTVQCGQYLGRVDDAGRIRLWGEGRMMVGPAVGL